MSLLTRQPDSLCVVRLSAIGDTCHALAAVRRLQDNWPDTKITWIIGKLEATLLGDIDGVEFIIFDKSAGVRAYRDVRRATKGRTFDALLAMHASMRVNWLYPLIDSPVKLGFGKDRARDFQRLFCNKQVPPVTGLHAMEAMLSFATAIGASETRLRFDIPIPDAADAFAQSVCVDGKPLVVISPCSSARERNYRNWSMQRFSELARYLTEVRRCNVVLTGGPSTLEAEYGEAISGAATVQNLIGRTDLKSLFALLARARCVICPDSGPAHMANAAGTPVVGLYATSNPERTGPYGSRDVTVNRYPDAVERFIGRPVGRVHWGQRVRDPRAMDLITLEDVKARVDGLLT